MNNFIKRPKMGFERRRTFTVDWHNKPEEKYGYKFRSKIERKFADYLENLKVLGVVKKWSYESETFDCGTKYRKQRLYTPDFLTLEDEGMIYYEVKTAVRQHDVSRFKWLRAVKPDILIILVLPYQPSGKTTASERQIVLIDNARKYVDRVLYINSEFKKFGIA